MRFIDKDINPKQLSPLNLAFIGDCVYEMLVRESLVAEANRPVNDLHKESVKFVSAKAQTQAYEKIKDIKLKDNGYLKELETINQTVYQSDINDDFNEYEIKLPLEENVNLKMKFDEPDDMISKIRKSLKKDEELNDRMSNCNSNNDFLLFLNNYKTNRNENNKIKAR